MVGEETAKVWVTVKTYPSPSDRYGETVCVAGVRAGDDDRAMPPEVWPGRAEGGTAMAAWSSPPMPSAAAPMASGPTPGADAAAVPAVPHSGEVAVIASKPASRP